MRAKRSVWSRAAITLLAAGVVLSMAGCDNRSAQWTEVVRLPSGETLRVNSRATFDVRSELGGPTSAFVQYYQVKVLDQQPDAPKWTDKLVPLLLARDPATSELVLVTTTEDGRVWQSRGRPSYPYWQFRLHDGQWREEPLADFVDKVTTNLLLNPFWIDDKDRLVTLAMKHEWRLKYGAHLSLLRVDRTHRMGRD